jgi:hypothetical protein
MRPVTGLFDFRPYTHRVRTSARVEFTDELVRHVFKLGEQHETGCDQSVNNFAPNTT